MNASEADKAGTFYCQVDTYLGAKDYLRGGRCVRLTGVMKSDFELLQTGDIGEGVESFIVDIDLREFLQEVDLPLVYKRALTLSDTLEKWEENSDSGREWFCIEWTRRDAGGSYFYATFSRDEPTYFAVKRISSIEQEPNLAAIAFLGLQTRGSSSATPASGTVATTGGASVPGAPDYTFSAFHVGQGMCSALYNSNTVVLFDAGAGKPVTRKRFLAGDVSNGLADLMQHRDIPYAVISHFDYDHWCLLAWDAALLAKVGELHVPDTSEKGLAFFDKVVHQRIILSPGFSWTVAQNVSVVGIRSKPSSPDSNGECLVCVVDIGGRKVLVPGDYAYCRMLSDKDPSMPQVALQTFDAVLVPHHGDEESAKSVPNPTLRAPAFFSAGTNQTYKHPRQKSIDEHQNAGFKPLHDREEPHIKKVDLC